MLSLDIIRKELKDVRYYYSRKEIFDLDISYLGANDVLEKVKKYNTAIQSAPPRLYDLYICLYIRNYTQGSLSLELGYTAEYIQMLHKKLLIFLQSYLSIASDADVET